MLYISREWRFGGDLQGGGRGPLHQPAASVRGEEGRVGDPERNINDMYPRIVAREREHQDKLDLMERTKTDDVRLKIESSKFVVENGNLTWMLQDANRQLSYYQEEHEILLREVNALKHSTTSMEQDLGWSPRGPLSSRPLPPIMARLSTPVAPIRSAPFVPSPPALSPRISRVSSLQGARPPSAMMDVSPATEFLGDASPPPQILDLSGMSSTSGRRSSVAASQSPQMQDYLGDVTPPSEILNISDLSDTGRSPCRLKWWTNPRCSEECHPSGGGNSFLFQGKWRRNFRNPLARTAAEDVH
ncbi:hypothetical protein CEXT_756741 [Caerostris extrusa]|uniref:Uncharacterized protein n=1 Tax=Caerostris extrusa TaxID=172846 RepID=A0AAV4XEK2_CAEEX|nr:hypothetical protein CEXT_756741 [Caerostris extrusa]